MSVPLEVIFAFIQSVPVGARFMRQFLPSYESGEIQVLDFGAFSGLRTFEYGPAASAFEYEGQERRIYLDRSQPLGVAAPLLFHEMMHALDDEFINSYVRVQELRERGRILLAEIQARLKKNAASVSFAECDSSERARLTAFRTDSEELRCERLLKTEVKAYREQAEFVAALKREFSGYELFLKSKEKDGFVLDRPVSEADIRSRYGLQKAA